MVAELPASRPQPADPERSLRQRLERPAGAGRLLERREELEEVLRLRGRVVEAGDIAADAGDPGSQRLLDVVIGEREVQPRHVVPLAGRQRRHDQVVVADVVRVPVGVDKHQVAKRAHAADRLTQERTERGRRPAVDHIQRVTRPVQDHVGDVGLALGGIQLTANDHQRARRHADKVAIGQLVRRRSRHGLGRPGNRERQHRDGEHSGWAHGSATFSAGRKERGMSGAAAAEAVAQRRPDVRNVQILVLRGRGGLRPMMSGHSPLWRAGRPRPHSTSAGFYEAEVASSSLSAVGVAKRPLASHEPVETATGSLIGGKRAHGRPRRVLQTARFGTMRTAKLLWPVRLARPSTGFRGWTPLSARSPMWSSSVGRETHCTAG